MLLKVDRDARMEPPIHTEYFLSGGATTLILALTGAKLVTSLLTRSAMPGHTISALVTLSCDLPSNMVVPPERTILE